MQISQFFNLPFVFDQVLLYCSGTYAEDGYKIFSKNIQIRSLNPTCEYRVVCRQPFGYISAVNHWAIFRQTFKTQNEFCIETFKDFKYVSCR